MVTIMDNDDEQAALQKALDAALLDDEDDDDSVANDDDYDDKKASHALSTAATPPASNASAKVEPAHASDSAALKQPLSLKNNEIDKKPSSTKPAQPAPTPPVVMGPPRPPPSAEQLFQGGGDPDKVFADMLQGLIGMAGELGDVEGGLLNGSEDPEKVMQLLMQQMQAQLSEVEQAESIKKKTSSSKPNSPNKTKTPAKKATTPAKKATGAPSSTTKSTTEVDDVISNLVQGIAKQKDTDKNTHHRQDDDDDDTDPDVKLLETLLQGLSGAGGGAAGAGGTNNPGFNENAIIDGMMEQLLAKELMYEPIKQVATRFPKWLEEQRLYLPEKEYQNRKKQCAIYQKLVKTYETTPEDTRKLTELMQEVHEYGQPPAEIIQEVAPGLELDDNGVPKFDNMGMPMGMNPNGSGGGSDEDCRIM